MSINETKIKTDLFEISSQLLTIDELLRKISIELYCPNDCDCDICTIRNDNEMNYEKIIEKIRS